MELHGGTLSCMKYGVRSSRPLAVVAAMFLASVCLRAQASGTRGKPAEVATSPPPATKIEAFTPTAGSVLTFGYDELGIVAGVSVDVREMRDTKGAGVRGLVVQVSESEYRKERSFVDADEIPELLKGFDALLEVKANPTQFKSFEVRYTTKGELQLTAFNSSRGNIAFAVQAGRVLKAQSIGLGVAEMQKLRGLFDAALQKLNTLAATK
jgi:hypothetical protein